MYVCTYVVCVSMYALACVRWHACVSMYTLACVRRHVCAGMCVLACVHYNTYKECYKLRGRYASSIPEGH